MRKIYADPITGGQEWGTLMSPDGAGIVGIHSQSDATPIKIANFEPVFQEFNGKISYRAWVFFGPQPMR